MMNSGFMKKLGWKEEQAGQDSSLVGPTVEGSGIPTESAGKGVEDRDLCLVRPAPISNPTLSVRGLLFALMMER